MEAKPTVPTSVNTRREITRLENYMSYLLGQFDDPGGRYNDASVDAQGTSNKTTICHTFLGSLMIQEGGTMMPAWMPRGHPTTRKLYVIPSWAV